MADSTIHAQLTDIFRQIFDDDSLVLTPATTAQEIPDWDSFTHVNIIVTVEAHFGIKFQTAEIEELKNVGDFIVLIERKLAAKKG
jgi:acyl carrier protein